MSSLEDLKTFYRFLNLTEVNIRAVTKERLAKNYFVDSEEEFIKLVQELDNSKLYTGIFAGYNQRKPKGTKDINVIGCKYIPLDVDLKDSENWESDLLIIESKLIELGLVHSLRVNSGNGYHYYFAIPEIKDNQKIAEILNKAKVLLVDINKCIDETIYNPERVMRIAGTHNRKPENKKDYLVTIEDNNIEYITSKDKETNLKIFNPNLDITQDLPQDIPLDLPSRYGEKEKEEERVKEEVIVTDNSNMDNLPADIDDFCKIKDLKLSPKDGITVAEIIVYSGSEFDTRNKTWYCNFEADFYRADNLSIKSEEPQRGQIQFAKKLMREIRARRNNKLATNNFIWAIYIDNKKPYVKEIKKEDIPTLLSLSTNDFQKEFDIKLNYDENYEMKGYLAKIQNGEKIHLGHRKNFQFITYMKRKGIKEEKARGYFQYMEQINSICSFENYWNYAKA